MQQLRASVRYSISLTSEALPALRKRLYESWHHLFNLLPPDSKYIVTLNLLSMYRKVEGEKPSLRLSSRGRESACLLCPETMVLPAISFSSLQH